MSKQAAIYTRTANNPIVVIENAMVLQEQECRAYCERQGYEVVQVYGDPNQPGTKTERPQYQQMLNDARIGRFDVIVATHEDRLYRGISPMLTFLDMLTEMKGVVTAELVKGTFDMATSPVRQQDTYELHPPTPVRFKPGQKLHRKHKGPRTL